MLHVLIFRNPSRNISSPRVAHFLLSFCFFLFFSVFSIFSAFFCFFRCAFQRHITRLWRATRPTRLGKSKVYYISITMSQKAKNINAGIFHNPPRNIPSPRVARFLLSFCFFSAFFLLFSAFPVLSAFLVMRFSATQHHSGG